MSLLDVKDRSFSHTRDPFATLKGTALRSFGYSSFVVVLLHSLSTVF